MTLVLKKDWDISVFPPNRKSSGPSHFAGRKKELAQLTNEILSRKNGAILISGHRGAGKTSMVYQALKIALERDKDLITVIMNAAQLDGDSTSQQTANINPKRIIENLIRRLYSVSAINSFGSDTKIQTLYKKAVAKETEFKELIQFAESQERETLQEENLQIKLNQIDNNTFVVLVSWVAATFYQLGQIDLFKSILGIPLVDKLIPLLLAFPIPYTVNFFYNRSETFKRSKRQSQEVEEIYKFDNAIGNLEFDLENIHSEIAGNGKKLIYVIDELDKLNTDQVKAVFFYFKNLFTLSEAIFIFIGGEDLFLLGSNETLGRREREYTYFTSRYYLSRPMWGDLSDYIDDIIHISNLTDEDLECFKRAVCFDATNDFFDLKIQIRDRITSFDENNRPIIEFVNSNADLSKARIHKALSMLYEGRYMYLNPLRWNENETMLRAAFSNAINIQKAHTGFIIADSDSPELSAQIVRDLHKFLHRLELLRIQADRQEQINNAAVSIRSYSVTGMVPNPPPDTIEDPTEFEDRFIQTFRYDYCELLVSLFNITLVEKHEAPISIEDFLLAPDKVLNMFDSLGINLRDIYNTQRKIYNNITRQVYPYPYQREVVQENEDNIKKFSENILNTQLRTILPRLTREVFSEQKLAIDNFNSNPQLFSGEASVIRTSLMNTRIPYEVVYRPDLSRQILFLQDGAEILAAHTSILQGLSQTHLVVYLSNNKSGLDNTSVYYIDTSSLSYFESKLRQFMNEDLPRFLK